MNLCVIPGSPLTGEGSLPGDKSISHRAALFSALAQGESRVENFLWAGVTQAMLSCLSTLGIHWRRHDQTLILESPGLGALPAATLHDAPPVLNCGNSATTLRLLAGALVAAGLPAVLDGSPGLRGRPMQRIITPLQSMGAAIHSRDGRAPLVLGRRSQPLHGLDYSLPVASAQVKSCLLLAGLAADGPSRLREPGPSRDHTERLLRSLGVCVESQRENGIYQTRLWPPGSLGLPPLRLSIPGDLSAAAFLVVAALITPGSQVALTGVGLNPTRTGLLDALLAMGADIQITLRPDQGGEPVGDLRVRHSRLRATHVSGPLVVRMIDEFPAFAIAAAFAEGVTRVSDAAELRHKESDRIAALCQELGRLGIPTQERPDGFTIQGGGALRGGEVNPHGDHRLAMALAVAGLAARQPVQVQQAEIIAESFPGFAAALLSLGANVREREAVG